MIDFMETVKVVEEIRFVLFTEEAYDAFVEASRIMSLKGIITE